MSAKDQLFEVMFAPKKLESFVLPERITKEFPNGKVTDNYLFYGTSGLGKSELAKFLGLNSGSFYYVNASLEGSVENLRIGSEIYDFCSTSSIIGGSETKVILLDELKTLSKVDKSLSYNLRFSVNACILFVLLFYKLILQHK